MKFDLYCSLHPKYQAKRFPKLACQACLILYWLSNGRKAVVEYKQKGGFVFLKVKEKEKL